MNNSSAKYSLTLKNIIYSEWIKFTSTPSAWFTLLGVVAAMTAFGTVAAFGGSIPGSTFLSSESDPVYRVLIGSRGSILMLGILGVMIGSREYSSGLIQTTFAATPARLPILAGQILAAVTSIVPVATLASFLAFTVGMAAMQSSGNPTVALSDAGALRAALGCAAYLTGAGVFGIGLGNLLRSPISGTGLIFGGFVAAPGLATSLIPSSWTWALAYPPSEAGASLTALTPTSNLLSVETGALVFLAWVVLAVIAGGASMLRRDV